MVPIRKGHCDLFIEVEGGVWIVNNERSAQAVWILALSVRVVPIRARLVDLVKLSVPMPNLGRSQLTGNE